MNHRAQDGIPLCLALSRLSPEVFFHPLWVHFDDFLSPFTIDLIYELQRQTQELLAKGEFNTSCQILLACAALQKRLNDCPAALTTLHRAWTLAELYDLPQVARWAAWGSSALCAQQGQYQQAADHLSWLYVKLKESGDWVLANIVEVIGRTISKKGKENSLVKIAFDWLVHWGESPLVIEAGHMKNNARHHPSLKALITPGSARGFTSLWWRSFLFTLKRIAFGELRLTWVEAKRGTTSAIVQGTANDRSTRSSFFRPPLQNTNLDSEEPFLSEGNLLSDSNHPPSSTKVFALSSPQEPPKPMAGTKQQPTLVIYTLGAFRIYQNDQLIETWSSRKAQSVFKYLIAHHRIPISKDVLMEIFWPDADPEAARRNLHQAIYALRQTLKTKYIDFQHILFENECYRLNPALDLWLDYEEFDNYVQAGQQYEQNHDVDMAMSQYGMAEGLYQDNFLCEDLYEEWPVARRQSLWQTYSFLALRLAQYYLSRREFSAAIAISRRILSMESAQEEAHQILMRCYLAQGQRHLAISQYQLCVQSLRIELELQPSAETEALYQQIAQG